MLTYGRRIPLPELNKRIDVRSEMYFLLIFSRHFYDNLIRFYT